MPGKNTSVVLILSLLAVLASTVFSARLTKSTLKSPVADRMSPVADRISPGGGRSLSGKDDLSRDLIDYSVV